MRLCRSSSARKFADRLMGLYNVEVAVGELPIYLLSLSIFFFILLIECGCCHIQVRHLPVGDAAWVARHRVSRVEYILDFIVERKRVDDLWTSIKDNRYKDQKFRLKVSKRSWVLCSFFTSSLLSSCFLLSSDLLRH